MTQNAERVSANNNYNEKVGEAYQVSKNGVITINLENESFQDEFVRQLVLIRKKREDKLRELQMAVKA